MDLEVRLAVSERPIKENSLRKMLTSPMFRRSGKIPIALGYDMRGEMRFVDLVKLIHAMYAGASGSGKSIGLLCLILSIVYLQSVNQVNLLLFDVGANTLEPFSDAPHLSYPIVKDPETALYVIQSLVAEMERRMKLDRSELFNLPALICVLDEYVSLITNIGDKKRSKLLSDAISNLLRRGRQAKIHMIIATQDPTIKNMKVDVGNITARMAFACAKYHNAIAILGEGGAEKLPGKGSMLFKSGETPEPMYLQGAYMTPAEIKKIVAHINTNLHDTGNMFVIPEMEALQLKQVTDALNPTSTSLDQKELAKVIAWALKNESVSKLKIMQEFKMGNRADAVMDALFRMNIVADKNANQPRVVVPKNVEDLSEEAKCILRDNGYAVEDINDMEGGV
jgi:S-DNA-T family DNA segregation ATPase FtsK/SpoIIIE